MENEATSIAGVPYTYEMLKRLRFTSMSLPSLRTMTQAGGKLHPDLHREFAEYALANGVDFVIMYGAAEATARMGYLPPDKSLEKYGSMGIAIPGGKFDLIDDAGMVITEPNTIGELVYYGDNVTLGYAECGADLLKGDNVLVGMKQVIWLLVMRTAITLLWAGRNVPKSWKQGRSR